MSDIISKIKEAGLKGRGGASFPVAIKWQAIRDNLKKNEKLKYYIVINAAEGEPGVKKDFYILENYPEAVLRGISACAEGLGIKSLAGIYFYTSESYYKSCSKKINKLLLLDNFLFLKVFWHWSLKPKSLSYVGGEETAVLNIIEGKKSEPRLKPPLPVDDGLFGLPTLVNNVETFYDVSLVASGSYQSNRFYTISGDVLRPGVYHLPSDWMIDDVLRLTGNYPSFKFFAQIGGDLCGEMLNSRQLNREVSGSASITVYHWFDTDKDKMIERLLSFFQDNSCGKCTPCREGTARLLALFKDNRAYSPEFWDILLLLKEASFCAYGKSLVLPLSSYYKNILQLK